MHDESAPPRLVARGIRKKFGAVTAVDGASLEARVGEVVALMGDNGAGKSSLIRCISGVYQADEGEVFLDGKRLDAGSATVVLDHGIETVYQDLSIVDPMSVTRNVFLGREQLRTGIMGKWFRLVDDKAMGRQASEALASLGAKIPSLDDPVAAMSGGQRQAIAIARAVIWGHKVVILDEPTAALGVEQSHHVLEMILALKQRDVTVVLISHNLEHVWQVADRITVMRRGKTVGTRQVAETTPEEIVALITGGSDVVAA